MATPVMPEAPEPQNRMMAAPRGGPMPGPAMQQPNAMQPPQAAPTPTPSPEQVIEARQHSKAVITSLTKLVATPRGELTKKDVFDAASDMIAQGAFPTPAAKQELIVHLAGLPDDESGLRKAVGSFLMVATANRNSLHGLFGEG